MKTSQTKYLWSTSTCWTGEDQKEEYLDHMIRNIFRARLSRFYPPSNVWTRIIQHIESQTPVLSSREETQVEPTNLDLMYLSQIEHYQDLINQAEQERLIRAARRNLVKRSFFYKRLICWLGHRFISWGNGLLKGYEPLPEDLSSPSLNLAR